MESISRGERLLWGLPLGFTVALLALGRVELTQFRVAPIFRTMLGADNTFFAALLCLWVPLLIWSGAIKHEEKRRWILIGAVGAGGAVMAFVPRVILAFYAFDKTGANLAVIITAYFMLIGLPAALAQIQWRPLLLRQRYNFALLHLAAPVVLYWLRADSDWNVEETSLRPAQIWPWVVVAFPYAATVGLGATKPIRFALKRICIVVLLVAWLPMSVAEIPGHGILRGLIWPVIALTDFYTPAERTAATRRLSKSLRAGDSVRIGKRFYRLKGVQYPNINPDFSSRLPNGLDGVQLHVAAENLGIHDTKPGVTFGVNLWKRRAGRSDSCQDPRNELNPSCTRKFQFEDLDVEVFRPTSGDLVISETKTKELVKSWLAQSLVAQSAEP